MVRISTTYDKDLKKKVFLVRGDEAYAKSTDCSLTVGSVSSGNIKGLCISTLTINLYRTVGNAQLILYDDDIPLETWNITSSTTSKTLTNYYLGYGASHELWAEYVPLDHQCLGSKSKRVTVSKEIPASLQINFTKNSASTQVDGGANLSFDYTVKKGSTNVADNTPVLVYVDGDYEKTVNTNSGKAISTLTGIEDGKHIIELEVDSTTSYYGNRIEYEALVGYQLNLTSYPVQFINNTSNTVIVNVRDYNNEAVTGGTLEIHYRDTKWGVDNLVGSATVTNGVATVNVEEIPVTGEYYASYKGSKSKYVVFTLYNPNGLTVSANPLLIGNGDISKVSVTLNDGRDGVPIALDIGGVTSIISSVNGTGTYDYTGNSKGDLTVTATVGDISESINITDSLTYWVSNTNHANNIEDVVNIIEGDKLEYSNYITFIDNIKSSGATSGIGQGVIQFEPLSYSPVDKEIEFTIAKKPLNVTDLVLKYAYGSATIININPYNTELIIPASKLKIGNVIKFGKGKVTINDEIIYTYGVSHKFDPDNPHMMDIVPQLIFNTQNGGELYIKDLIYKI